MSENNMLNANILLEAVNAASVSARRSWIFFMALMAYFAIAVTSVTHEQLLLDAPLMLPLLQVPMPVSSFFFFSPIFLVGVHTIMLLQHAALAEKVHAWDAALAEYEQSHPLKKAETNAWRKSLSTYFYTQASMSVKGELISMGLRSFIAWITITLAPLLLILYFQAVFLAYHDTNITWAHRGAAAADLFLLLMLVFTTRFDNLLGKGKAWLNGLMRGVFALSWIALTALSFVVLTIPGEPIDETLASWELGRTKVPMHLEEREWKAKGSRYAFWPTAFLLEGQVNYETGKSTTWFGFSRSLIVPDKIIVADRKYKTSEISLSLRGRDLRYATFDRSNLQNVDFTAAKMTAVSMKGTDLRYALFGCAEKGRPPLWRSKRPKKKRDQSWSLVPNGTPNEDEACSVLFKANMEGANLSSAKIYKANFEQANLRQTDLRNANIVQTYMFRAELSDAILQGAKFHAVNLVGAKLYRANLKNTMIWHTDLSLSELGEANLNGATLEWSSLKGADLSNSSLYGTLLPQRKLIATNFSDAKIWWTTLYDVKELKLSKFDQADISPPPEAIWKILKEGKKTSNIRTESFFEIVAGVTSLQISFETMVKNRLNVIPNEQSEIENWGGSSEGKIWRNIASGLSRKEDDEYDVNVTKYMGDLACLSRYKKLAVPIILRYSDKGTYLEFNPDPPNRVPSPKDEALDAVISQLPSKSDSGWVDSGEYLYDNHEAAAQLYTRLTGKNCPNANDIPQEYMDRLKKAAKPPKDETEKSE